MAEFRAFLAAHPRYVAVEIARAQGSTPREAGTIMLVSQTAIWGTIGGGQFEFMAIANARALLAGEGQEVMDIPLGPEIGQCCGGRTELRFRVATPELSVEIEERLKAEADHRPEIYIFGAGHVGHALVRALAPLPVRTVVVETRAHELETLPSGTQTRLVALPEALAKEIAAGGAAVVLTHDHALDFMIAREALMRTDLAYVGMIGSATKRATFAHWLAREGENAILARLTLPIGGALVKDKRPEVIAAMTAAEILTALAVYRQRSSS